MAWLLHFKSRHLWFWFICIPPLLHKNVWLLLEYLFSFKLLIWFIQAVQNSSIVGKEIRSNYKNKSEAKMWRCVILYIVYHVYIFYFYNNSLLAIPSFDTRFCWISNFCTWQINVERHIPSLPVTVDNRLFRCIWRIYVSECHSWYGIVLLKQRHIKYKTAK